VVTMHSIDRFLSDSLGGRVLSSEVKMTESQTLLADYVRNGTEAAFRELVTRYLDLVYSTALRLVGGDTHLAQDVAQIVFTDLARKARSLPKDILLGGWLHRDACFVAGKTMRGRRRRQAREQQAAEMNALHDNSEPDLSHLGPLLDEAIERLPAADRTAILLRFFEHRDFRSIGLVLGSNEDTAQKRVSRALEKLHSLLQHRGVSLSVVALGTLLSAQAVTAAPPGLAVVLTGAALATGGTSGGISATFFKIMTISQVKLGILGALVIGGLAVPIAIHYAWVPVSEKHKLVETGMAAEPTAASPNREIGSKKQAAFRPPFRQDMSAGSALATRFDARTEIMKGQGLSAEQAQLLESKLAQDPKDLSARCQLLGYYWRQQMASRPAREARQNHILWFIQHHPELSLSTYGNLDRQLDGQAFAEGKTLWLQQANENPQNTSILGNAAAFCLLWDRPSAEELLKQAQAVEPANPTWPEQLAHLYSLDAQSVKPGEPNQAAVKAFEQMQNAQANTSGEMQRFHNFEKLATLALDAGDIEKAQTYATALLQGAAQPQQGWSYGDAIYRGNLVLGRIALRNGQLEVARQYLIASARTTGSPVLGSFGPNMTLAKELLEQGEKGAVLEYFELCAAFWKNDKLADWTKQVNQGWMPDFGANLSY
jgi:RNA polymerase sigma factor (sigma-70 family)